MVWYEERHSKTCIQVSCVPTSEGRTSKTYETLHPVPISEWKWEHITMDFVVDLSRTQIDHDAIWGIVDRLTKSAHFLAIYSTFSLDRLARLYIDEIVKLHRV